MTSLNISHLVSHRSLSKKCSTARLKRDGTRAETIVGLSETWTSQFKSAWESVQSITGSREVRISGQTMDRQCYEVQCKSSGYPLQSPISPSLPLPRVTVCHHVSKGLYHRSQTDSFLRKFSPAHFCANGPSHIQDQNSQQQVSRTEETATQQTEILASRTPYTLGKNNP
jgi:hypothetical protein